MPANMQLEAALDAADDKLGDAVLQLRFTAKRMVASPATCNEIADMLESVRREIRHARTPA